MKKLYITLSLITLPLSFIYAQSADDIINKYINAVGGKAKLETIKNVYMEGTMNMGGSPVSLKYWVVNKKSMRYEYTAAGQTSFNILTNDSGWVYNAIMGGAPDPLSASMVRASQPQLDPSGLLCDYKAKGYKVEYKGKSSVSGSQTYKVVEKISDSLANTYYFDTATYYIVRVTFKSTVDGRQIELGRDFGDYKKTDNGYMFPFKMNTGGGFGDVEFTSIKVNTTIDPKLFKPNGK
ncbi:MAG TPA: hypothetical protein VNZ45_11215 [Bacteroidia bacterium]|jgi:hypothetical protein|nr:hypothetical protein [Bacteroidia bacterium]